MIDRYFKIEEIREISGDHNITSKEMLPQTIVKKRIP